MKLKLFFISLFTLSFTALDAGTIVYRTSGKSEEYTLSKIKIISIDKKVITIKQSGGTHTIPLAYLISYYDTNIDVGDYADNTSDYQISIRKIKMPETGYKYSRSKKTKKKSKKTSNCKIEFSINRKFEKAKSKNIRMPYFYLFVLTTGSEVYGRRPVYTYYYPKDARVSLKTYNEAKIIEAVKSMKRPLLYYDSKSYLGKSAGKLSSAGGYPPVNIALKKVKNKRIIAYHLEVWGKDKIISTKNWRDMRYSVGGSWWKNR